MRSRTIKDIVKQLAEKFHLSEDEIFKIISIAQTKAHKEIITSDRENLNFKNCLIPGLGKLYVKKGKIQWIKDNLHGESKEMVEFSSNTEEELQINSNTPEQGG